MDVAAWLKNLGLGQYEAAFRDNAIEGDLLPSLTADDLKDLGVTIVGHRRKLLDAIAALGAASEPTPPPAAANPPPTLSSPAVSSRLQARSDASAERRHLTVLFCDLVGSTAISASLDAEDWRNLVSAYLDAASEAVTQMGGRVAKKLGDGLMALFGHPIAQENDAERAVRAALAIQRSLAELNRNNAGSGRPELVARIGVETGAVVVDPDGEIFGDAPNVAARVQALADPGTVLITARVQRQVAGLFVAEDCGAHALKGAPEPTTLFRIVRASGAGRRSGQRALTPLVGREDEMAVLLRRWDRARRGEGQFVMIVGEPGLGKSRLIEEFRTRLADTPHTWVEWSSSQLLQNTPFHPIADWGRQRFGGAEAPAERRLADLETSLAQVKLDTAEYIPLLAPLVDIPLPPERALALAPEELRRRQLAAISGLVPGGGARAAGRARGRGSALDRPDHARGVAGLCGTWRARAAVGCRNRAAGIPRAVGRALASWRDDAYAPRSRAGSANGRRNRRASRLVERGDRWRRRAYWRRAAVHRGSHAAPARTHRTERRAGDPADLAAIPDRAARPARSGARGRDDRRRAWARLFLFPPARSRGNRPRRRCNRRWKSSPRPTFSWSRACRPRPNTVSSTR